MQKLTIGDLDVAGRRVLVRVDFNVPLKDGEVTDETRIVSSLPTIRNLSERGARVVLMSHLGRPKGKPDPAYSLEPVARRLAALLEREVRFVNDCVGEAAVAASERLEDGDVLLLENLRFHAEEEANDGSFAGQLALNGDLYVNDAFGTAHRAHASTVGVPERMSRAAAGLLLQRELDVLDRVLAEAARPFVAILGGAKISGKIDVIENLLPRVDTILVGGGMTYTFYRALDVGIGDSLLESDRVETARETLEEARNQDTEILLPVDSIVSAAADGSEEGRPTEGMDVPDGCLGVDIGPRTVAAFRAAVAGAGTVVWNGPLGIFEVPAFAEGTLAVAKAVAEATRSGATTVVGGGDSVAAISRAGLGADDFTHVSTGGGAFLEYLEGKELPGVAALTDKG
jgi:phosphoglycerate kinase